MELPGRCARNGLLMRAFLTTLAVMAGCASETSVQVNDFTQPLVLDHVAAAKSTIVGMVLEVSGSAAETITVEVRCDDKLVRRFDVSGVFRRKMNVDAYRACVNLTFQSGSFVNSSMTVSYSYTVLS